MDDGNILKGTSSRRASSHGTSSNSASYSVESDIGCDLGEDLSVRADPLLVAHCVGNIDIEAIPDSHAERFSAWRTTSLPKHDIVDLIQDLCSDVMLSTNNLEVDDRFVLALSTAGKMFIGGVIEKCMKHVGQDGVTVKDLINASESTEAEDFKELRNHNTNFNISQ